VEAAAAAALEDGDAGTIAAEVDCGQKSESAALRQPLRPPGRGRI
jgi:hypothetical protein